MMGCFCGGIWGILNDSFVGNWRFFGDFMGI
jgi:hypothetical protein